MSKPIPFLVVSDAPNLNSGLARIAKDLVQVLHQREEELGIKVSQLAWGYSGAPYPWPVYPIFDTESWGGGDIKQALRWIGAQDGGRAIVFTVWDPSRCAPIAQALKTSIWRWVELWGYFAIDSHNEHGRVGGPAEEALGRYDRVLAYSGFGSSVIRQSLSDEWLERHEEGKSGVPELPHGITDDWTPDADPGVERIEQVREMRAETTEVGGIMVGCVASNQPRKDFGLLFQALSRLSHLTERPVRAWICTDYHTHKAWSIPELAEVYGFNSYEKLVVTTQMSDRQLAECYRMCDTVISPGLGEGFCYPNVEAQACGTPVVHGNFAGGPQFLVRGASRLVEPIAYRIESCYALQRPVYNPASFAMAALACALQKIEMRGETEGLLSGGMEYLKWRSLEAPWREWFARGLRGKQHGLREVERGEG